MTNLQGWHDVHIPRVKENKIEGGCDTYRSPPLLLSCSLHVPPFLKFLLAASCVQLNEKRGRWEKEMGGLMLAKLPRPLEMSEKKETIAYFFGQQQVRAVSCVAHAAYAQYLGNWSCLLCLSFTLSWHYSLPPCSCTPACCCGNFDSCHFLWHSQFFMPHKCCNKCANADELHPPFFFHHALPCRNTHTHAHTQLTVNILQLPERSRSSAKETKEMSECSK